MTGGSRRSGFVEQLNRRRILQVAVGAAFLALSPRTLRVFSTSAQEDDGEVLFPPETEDPAFHEPGVRGAAEPPAMAFRARMPEIAADGNTPPPPPPPPVTEARYNAAAVFYRGDATKNLVYLTFDDCSSPSLVESAMDVAERAGAWLTFFPAGKFLGSNPSLWRSVAERGHGIENHTYSHSYLTRLSEPQIRAEITSARDALAQILGRDAGQRFLWPPGGDGIYNYDARIPRVAVELGYKIAMWNSDSNGWRVYPRTDAPAVNTTAANAIRNLGPGSIVIQHVISVDVLALSQVLAECSRRGYACVRMQEGIV